MKIEDLAKPVFFLSLLLCTIVFSSMLLNAVYSKEAYKYHLANAIAANNVQLCSEIENMKFSALCYNEFVKHGYDCSAENNEEQSPACLLALAVYKQDEFLCDAYFSAEQLPYNLECRVTLLIERYSDEGLSDCCHME